MSRTKAERKAQDKYLAQFATLRIRLAPEEHERLKAHAKEQGLSLNKWALAALRETEQREKEVTKVTK